MISQNELLAATPLDTVELEGWGLRISGKVRDIYRRDGLRLLITTDRVSAFDVVLGLIPFKGQVLNQLSAWWFEQTRDIVANHMLDVPDPNVMLAREATPLPIEVIVRGFITGVTKTSLWTLYEQGERKPYGIQLPEGLRKNDRLPEPVLTPTTKANQGAHDEALTRTAILERGLVKKDIYEQVEAAALALFKRGQAIAEQAGLILVDTKYEFGLIDGEVILIDEVHTPDSSRYWIAGTGGNGNPPENFDKEFLRVWFAERGYRGEGTPPVMPPEFKAQVAERYIAAYERLTQLPFVPGEQPTANRIAQKLAHYELGGS